MPNGSVKVNTSSTIRFDRTSAIIAGAKAQLRNVVNASAVNIQSRAAQVAPVDTGSLRASIYVTNGTESDYNTRAAQAEALNHDVVIVPEVDPEFVISPSSGGPLGKDAYLAIIGVAAGHGVDQEFGTRFIRPQPFLIPSVLGEESNFTTAMSHIIG